MSSKRRAGASAAPHAEIPATGFDPVPAAADRPPPPLDPAVLVAVEALRRAAACLPPASVPIGSPGSAAVVHTPSADWTEVAAEAWAVLAHGGVQGRVGGGGDWIDRTAAWTAFIRPDAASRTRRNGIDTGDDLLAKAMWTAKAAAGFSPDPEALLPRDLVQCADVRLKLSLPMPEDVAAAALLMCGGTPGEDLTDAEAAVLTPRLLRLARRPGQDADGYVAKLRDLLARERAAPAAVAVTPRDAPGLHRLHGMDDAVTWGLGVAADLKGYADGALAWSQVGGHACLLSGPPGCGKTLFARALAATCGVPLVTGSYGQWHGTGSAHQGDLLKAMRSTFADAGKRKPCILFIDEIDSFPNRAAVTHAWRSWETQVVNGLLELVDGAAGREGVVLVGACNNPETLDPALVRSGRLDRHIRIGLPDRAGLERILREHLADDLPGESLSGLALAAAGASGADAERYVRGARRRARAAGRAMVPADLAGEIGGGDLRGAEELRIAAVHEAGHAVALCDLLPGSLEAVTLRANVGRGGTASSGSLVRNADIRRHLVVLLAGRAAEEAAFGAPSSGAGGGPDSDLALATLAAAAAAAALGFGDTVGLVWSGVPDAAGVTGMMGRDPDLRAHVRGALADAYRDALALVRRRGTAVGAVAAALLERGALDGAEAAALVGAHPAEGSGEDAP